jgi:hypothetical protein
LIHEQPDLAPSVFFDSQLSREGAMKTYTLHRKDWRDLIAEAIDDNEGRFLEPFSDLAWLFSAYIAIVPYRAWTGVLMWLDGKLNMTWYDRNNFPS